MLHVRAQKCRVLVLNSYPDPPPFRNPVSAPDILSKSECLDLVHMTTFCWLPRGNHIVIKHLNSRLTAMSFSRLWNIIRLMSIIISVYWRRNHKLLRHRYQSTLCTSSFTPLSLFTSLHHLKSFSHTPLHLSLASSSPKNPTFLSLHPITSPSFLCT